MLYLIKSQNYLKIGYTDNLKDRLRSYDIHNPQYELLDICNGTIKDETAIHHLVEKYNYKSEWYYYNDEIIKIWKKCKKILESGKEIQYTKPPKLSLLQIIATLNGNEKINKSLEYILSTNTKYKIDILLYLCNIVNYNSGTIQYSIEFKKEIAKTFSIDYTQVNQLLNTFVRLGFLEGNNKIFVLSKNFLKFNNSTTKQEFIENVKKMLK